MCLPVRTTLCHMCHQHEIADPDRVEELAAEWEEWRAELENEDESEEEPLLAPAND